MKVFRFAARVHDPLAHKSTLPASKKSNAPICQRVTVWISRARRRLHPQPRNLIQTYFIQNTSTDRVGNNRFNDLQEKA